MRNINTCVCTISLVYRGGLSYVNQRYFNVAEESEKRGEPVSMVYLDAVNLYGWAMSQNLATRDFHWLSEEELTAFDVAAMVDMNGDTGYIIECTLEYDQKYHTDHNSLPLAAHRQVITQDMLSEYAARALKAQQKKSGMYKASKLTSSYLRRNKYVCHGVNLKLYLELGMRLIKIHRIIAFTQTPFIKPYIQFCSRMRAESKTKSRSNIFKMAGTCNTVRTVCNRRLG